MKEKTRKAAALAFSAALVMAAGIPAYAVFHNSTLEGLARLKPTTRRGAMNVHGIGEQKAARYLDDFLEVIAEHCGV